MCRRLHVRLPARHWLRLPARHRCRVPDGPGAACRTGLVPRAGGAWCRVPEGHGGALREGARGEPGASSMRRAQCLLAGGGAGRHGRQRRGGREGVVNECVQGSGMAVSSRRRRV